MSLTNLVLDLLVRYGFQVLGALVILAAGLLVARWTARLADHRLRRQAVEPPLRTLIVRVARLVILLLAVVVALDQLGFQVAPLVAGIGVAGIGIGLAFQGVLSNLVAGLSIIFTKPFRVGEYIELLTVHGTVHSIELFSTTLVHADHSRVIIPNGKIVGEILHNFGAVRQLHLSMTVPHDADLGQVLELARTVVEAHARVMKEPAPVIGITGVEAVGIRLGVGPWVAVADYGSTAAELYQALVERFRVSAITVPVARHEVRLLERPMVKTAS